MSLAVMDGGAGGNAMAKTKADEKPLETSLERTAQLARKLLAAKVEAD